MLRQLNDFQLRLLVSSVLAVLERAYFSELDQEKEACSSVFFSNGPACMVYLFRANKTYSFTKMTAGQI